MCFITGAFFSHSTLGLLLLQIIVPVGASVKASAQKCLCRVKLRKITRSLSGLCIASSGVVGRVCSQCIQPARPPHKRLKRDGRSCVCLIRCHLLIVRLIWSPVSSAGRFQVCVCSVCRHRCPLMLSYSLISCLVLSALPVLARCLSPYFCTVNFGGQREVGVFLVLFFVAPHSLCYQA